MLQKGQKIRLPDQDQLQVEVAVQSCFTVDISCFAVDGNNKLSDDRYMIFYNQKSSPANEIVLLGENPSKFLLKLSTLPMQLHKLVFTAAIDGLQGMSEIESLTLTVGTESFVLEGKDFYHEKAIIIAELYKKDNAWRLNAVGQGFNGGLKDLLKYFGGEEAPTQHSAMTVMVAQEKHEALPEVPKETKVSKVSLVKRFEEKAPQLVELAKKASVELEKNNLAQVCAQVAFVLDASGSMMAQYRRGQVQETVNRIFPLAVHFDDDEQMETWAFADRQEKLSNVAFGNYHDYVEVQQGGWQQWMRRLNSAYNNEPVVMRAVIESYTGLQAPEYKSSSAGLFGFGKKVHELPALADISLLKSSPLKPVLVLFISDGGVAHDAHIEYLVKWSSNLPIFWQFIGIGGSNYGALERLDSLAGRFIDNANFFAIDDLKQISESELYHRMTKEFPKWLEIAHQKNIIANYRR